jgi:hypothetical protein
MHSHQLSLLPIYTTRSHMTYTHYLTHLLTPTTSVTHLHPLSHHPPTPKVLVTYGNHIDAYNPSFTDFGANVLVLGLTYVQSPCMPCLGRLHCSGHHQHTPIPSPEALAPRAVDHVSRSQPPMPRAEATTGCKWLRSHSSGPVGCGCLQICP